MIVKELMENLDAERRVKLRHSKLRPFKIKSVKAVT